MSKFRSLASQLCAIFPYICLQFANGSSTGYQVVLVAELYKENSEMPMSLQQLTWFAGLDIFQPVGTVFAGLLVQRLGNRPIAFTAALLFIASLLLFYYSTTTTMMFAGRLLCSLFATKPMSNPYISEVSEPKYRGHFLALIELLFASGSSFTLLLGSLAYWRTIAMINLVFPVLAALTILLIPQSPTWLATKGRLYEAEKALCWLRGWVEPEQVQTEFRTLVKTVRKTISFSDEQKEFTSETVNCEESLAKSWQPYFQRSFLTPLGTMCLIVLLYSLSGMGTVETYATVIFRKLDSPIQDSVATAIMGATRIIGSLLILFTIRRTGKRKLVFFSVLLTGFCYLTIAIVAFFNFSNEYRWIPTISLIVARFANASGVGAIVFMLPGEIFPSSVRYIGTSLSISAKIVVESLIKKIFLYAVAAVTMPGVFIFFAVINFTSLIVYFLLMPETEGKSLKEIEDHYKGVRYVKGPGKLNSNEVSMLRI